MRLPRTTEAIGAGMLLGATAVLLSLAYLRWPELMVIFYVLALAATFACGAYVLLVTWIDMARHPHRGARIRPIRGFDIVAGLVLAAPSLWALWPFLRAF